MKRHFNLLASVLLVIAMVFAFASCELIEQYIPGINQPDEPDHVHAYVDGKCECGEADPDYVAPHTHNFVEGKCECGESDPNYTKPECTEHAYSIEVTKEATCTEAGSKTFTCTVCGHSYEQEIAPNGHTEEDIPGKSATCTEPGLSSGLKCSVCGDILEEQTAINPKGHSYVEGTCSACGEVDPEYNGPKTYDFDATTHNWGWSAEGTKADGDSELVGTNDFFKLIFSAKSKIDTTSKKDWPDGFAIGSDKVNRIAWGGSTVVGENTKNAVEITVDGSAVVRIWWICGGDGRQVAIYNADGSVLVQSEETSTKNTPYLSEFTIENSGTYYIGNIGGGANYFVKMSATVTPAEEVKNEGSINVETTDTYTMYDFDSFTFTATEEGYYTFKIPAGLGAMIDGSNAPEVDYYMDENGGEFTVGLEAGQEIVVWISSTIKGTWTIDWSLEAGEVEEDGGDDPIVGTTELVVGENTVVFADGELSEGKEFSFTVTEEGTYTFRCDLMAAVMDAEGNSMGRGQVYLTPGTYRVVLFSMMPMPSSSFVVNITFEAPATGEPDGSEQFPYVWETLPESVVVDYSVISGKVYYVFTATADGSVTFTWPVEGDSWYDYFELVNGMTSSNSGSGFMDTAHSFVVEAGKTYRVSLGSWSEAGSHTIAISFSACNHDWSEATCTAPSTCANCGATTGDKADHVSTVAEPTCTNPDVCGVCGEVIGYVDHAWDDGVVITPADCATETDGTKLLTCTVCGETQEETIWAFHSLEETIVSATCTVDGSYHAVCTVCGYEENNVIEAQGHYNYYATCGETTNCMECGEEFTLEHDFSWSPATCTDPAYCSNCWQYIGEALGHNYDETGLCTECYLTHTLVIAGSDAFFGSNWVLEDENNILDFDYENLIFTKSYKSAVTGVQEFKIVDVTNAYNWDNCYPSSNYRFYACEGDEVVISINLATKAVSCTVNGVATTGDLYLVVGDKSLCGDINSDGGDWGWEFENYANLLTLNAEGKYQIVYTNVAAGSHGIKVVKNFSWDGAWGGTTTDNYMIDVATAGSTVTITFDPATGISHSVEAPHVHEFAYPCDAHCMTCGELVNENAAHTIVAVEAVAPTCYENGNVAYWYCSDCGLAWTDEALTQQTNLKSVILPMAHGEIVHVEAKAATCTDNGNIEYWYCSAEDCGQAWLDADCTRNTNLKAVVLPAAGHADENADYKCDTCSTKMLPEDGTTLTIPQALAIGKLFTKDNYTTQKYYITGIVTNVYNTTYGNLYLKDAEGNKICIYGLYSADGETRYDAMSYKPVEGDELTVYTVLGFFNEAQGKNAWMDDVVAHEHDYVASVKDPTCTTSGYTTHACSICGGSYTDSEVEALGHTTDNGTCDRCGLTFGGDEPVIGTLAEFTFGANGSASHSDPNTKFSNGKSYTVDGYTLKFTSATNCYDGGRDAKGNSCMKMGTSSKTGSFTVTVADNVTEVVIYVAQYKANTTKISVNGGAAQTITTASNNGEYTAITIDTSVNKTFTFATVSGGVRCMIDKIVYNGVIA